MLVAFSSHDVVEVEDRCMGSGASGPKHAHRYPFVKRRHYKFLEEKYEANRVKYKRAGTLYKDLRVLFTCFRRIDRGTGKSFRRIEITFLLQQVFEILAFHIPFHSFFFQIHVCSIVIQYC